MNILRIEVENSAELLNASAYDAGALIKLEYSTDGTNYSVLSSTAIVSGTSLYTLYHAAGTTTTLYRTRYSNSGGTIFSEYSDAFSATTAPIEYATLALVKNRIGITDTTDDSIIEVITGEANDWLEGRIGFPVGPTASEARTFDGSAVRGGILPVYPYGVRTVSVVKTTDGTDGTQTTQTLADVLVRPHAHERTPGWPAFELWVKDSADWSWPTTGYDVIEITATWGWAIVPPELVSIATRIAVAAYRNRGQGTSRETFVGADVDGIAAEEMTASDWRTIGKYQSLRSPIA